MQQSTIDEAYSLWFCHPRPSETLLIFAKLHLIELLKPWHQEGTLNSVSLFIHCGRQNLQKGQLDNLGLVKISEGMFFFHTVRSSNNLVNNQIFKWKLINTRVDKAIKAIWGSDLGWPDDSWERQPTINYFGKVFKENSDKPFLTISSQAWERKWNHELLFKISDTTCQCDPKNASLICYKISSLVYGDPWVCNKRQKASESNTEVNQIAVQSIE